MATINLGRIKPVFQGAFNALTTYVVDDIVTFGGETFICILGSTGNATSNSTYWSKLAKKGDDVTQLTTHGDILFRGSAGVERLAAGTSGYALVTKGASADPEWASATGIAWENKTSTFVATLGGAYICDTSSGAFTVTLPATPADNDYVIISDAFGKFATAAVTINGNGYNVAGDPTLVADTKYATLRLTFKTSPDVDSSVEGWVLT
jgi:hypothetical protein